MNLEIGKINLQILLFICSIYFQCAFSQVRLTPRLGNRTRVGYYRTTTITPTSSSSSHAREKPTIVLQARAGQFFVYSFAPNDFQNGSTANKTTSESEKNAIRERFGIREQGSGSKAWYDYSASLDGHPDLPSWMNLAKTPDDQSSNRGFLYGTPERDGWTDDIAILARNAATNDVRQKLIRIQVRDDKRSASPTKQIAEIWVQNYDAWEILSSTSTFAWSSDLSNVHNSSGTSSKEETDLLHKLRYTISRAFRGRGIKPYIRDLKPATHAGARSPSVPSEKVGFVVYVGTSTAFPVGLQHLAVGLNKNQEVCNRSEIIPPDSYFSPTFQIDWCRFRIYNATRPSSNDAALLIDGQQIRGGTGLSSYDDIASSGRFHSGHTVRHYRPVARHRDYSWEWIMVAVVPLAILLILVLILSAVFFGCREGQHWRDYKTPREQLTEYVNLRRTQDRLRMLSDQRQSMDILDATERASSALATNRRPTAPSSPTMSVGKQTVAQAAAMRGSGMDLYKDTDSFDERDQLLGMGGYRKSSIDQHEPLRRPSYDDQRFLINRDSSV